GRAVSPHDHPGGDVGATHRALSGLGPHRFHRDLQPETVQTPYDLEIADVPAATEFGQAVLQRPRDVVEPQHQEVHTALKVSSLGDGRPVERQLHARDQFDPVADGGGGRLCQTGEDVVVG